MILHRLHTLHCPDRTANGCINSLHVGTSCVNVCRPGDGQKQSTAACTTLEFECQRLMMRRILPRTPPRNHLFARGIKARCVMCGEHAEAEPFVERCMIWFVRERAAGSWPAERVRGFKRVYRLTGSTDGLMATAQQPAGSDRPSGIKSRTPRLLSSFFFLALRATVDSPG